MPRQSEPNLRIVVQFIAGSPAPVSQYRLIAYSSARTFPPVNLSSIGELTERLEAAGILAELHPHLDGPTPSETKIVYSADLRLNEAQLKILGLVS